MILSCDFMISSSKLETSRLSSLGSGVYALNAVLGQGSADGHLLCKAPGAIGFWLEADMEVGCPFGLRKMNDRIQDGQVGVVPLDGFYPFTIHANKLLLKFCFSLL